MSPQIRAFEQGNNSLVVGLPKQKYSPERIFPASINNMFFKSGLSFEELSDLLLVLGFVDFQATFLRRLHKVASTTYFRQQAYLLDFLFITTQCAVNIFVLFYANNQHNNNLSIMIPVNGTQI